MSAQTRKAPSLKNTIAAISAKRDVSLSTKSDPVKETPRDVEEAPPDTAPAGPGQKTLPKVTIYAHANVLKAVRLLAVEDGVQAQVILRRALRDYLATRGHHFDDLAAGK